MTLLTEDERREREGGILLPLRIGWSAGNWFKNTNLIKRAIEKIK